MDNLAFLCLYTLLTALITYSFTNCIRLNPVPLFLVSNWIVGAGTIMLLDFGNNEDTLYAFLIFILPFVFGFASLMFQRMFSLQKKYNEFYARPIITSISTIRTIWLLLILSVMVTYAYYAAIGYNLFNNMIMGVPMDDFISMRLNTYSGSSYYAPGYVNQFKNIILPLTSFFILFSYKGRINFAYWLMCAVLCYINLYALLGTGQRAPLVYAGAMILYSITGLYRIKFRWIIIPSITILILFGMYSVANSRIDEFSLVGSIIELAQRVFYVEQFEGILSFKYTLNYPIEFAQDWFDSLIGIFPWATGSRLEHDAYAAMHGTDRGTTAISLVTSAYYNLGFYFYIVILVFLSFVYTALYNMYISGPRSLERTLVYGSLFLVIGSYSGGTPVYIIQKGAVVLFAAIIMLDFNARRAFK